MAMGVYGGAWSQLPTEKQAQAGELMPQIGATMMGFVLAMVAILATFGSFRLGRNMQRTGHFQVLLKLMLLAAVAFGLVTVVGVVISIWHASITANWPVVLFWLSLWATLLVVDAIHKLFKVITLLGQENL